MIFFLRYEIAADMFTISCTQYCKYSLLYTLSAKQIVLQEY